ncbi:MAG: phosphoglycerate mutase [Zetaproteobacteria bacterium CG12_big_fil_rev_8_21_14_0_65_54_13]|nr:MAG: phosphoglycerate mutase [Zetaproteobacteria bacterium CG23_combo_of_CG06-09_8_20_14_all_54_7]PIW48132.1 MAG: phosphoglycerate mutase [Zetaproteobacteria bacterium CG12_big_fil_rev_8_21_14_0_65_54_13]PIX55286.1 MAG: phosphoglycerate mutase [Zetaproteobacteria bacterium CG_4_10_14_3_um_filter_54_28]PJA26860.1 MAG: phosphoglycerate mutase [Zetaproteobacteria bacterium CG_4_9_14_3_um_filter_54_145]
MKTLILIRHAKSDWDHPEASDYERTLNKRGLHDAPEMGHRLAGRKLLPELFTASTAVRARMTAELIARAMGYPEAQLLWRDELYLAAPATMLDIIRSTPDTVGTLALLAHNPGISELVERLTRQPFENIPTAGVVTLTAQIDHWREAGQRWQMQDFDFPKHLQ